MADTKRVYKRYFTKDKLAKINPKSVKAYEKYLRSNTIKNKDVKETTYKVYQNYFNQFLVFLEEEYDNIFIHDDEFMEDAVDVMENFIGFLQDTLGNNKKVINTKLSAVSSYYGWAVKRGIVEIHPFDKKLDRMKGANDEKLISSYFLEDDQIDKITKRLVEDAKNSKGKYDIQDLLIWSIALDSANRLGALARLRWSSLNLDTMSFEEIREKRGKYVDVPFTSNTKAIIETWRKKRLEMDNLECDSIFIVKYKGEYQPMSKTSIYMRVRKIGEIIGLEDFRPHCIRKTQLNRVYKKTNDIVLTQQLGNHESAETTISHYIKPKSKSEILGKINDLMK